MAPALQAITNLTVKDSPGKRDHEDLQEDMKVPMHKLKAFYEQRHVSPRNYTILSP
jgi:hypothetical protein